MEKYYKFLGVDNDATDQEVEFAYKALKEKYSADRFLEGEEGNNATKNLSKLEFAYSEIMKSRNSKGNPFFVVENFIKTGDVEAAQRELDGFNERGAEWHYYQALIFYKKHWTNECRKQLEIAISMDPHNKKYKEELKKLDEKVDYENRQYKQAYGQNAQPQQNQQMGGDGCSQCVDCCTTWLCCNCAMNSCCR